jgi:predicted nucleotidyltransferase
MDTRAIKHILKKYRAALSQAIRVQELIVFGSQLEGMASEGSDLDVIVVSNDFATLSEDERLDILEEAAEATSPLIHAWGFTEQELAAASELTTLGYARQAGMRI